MAAGSARRWPNQSAVVDGSVVLTFSDVADQLRQVASALTAAGVQVGDRVGLWAPNSAHWITAALGIQGAGAWLVPLNTRFKPAEASYILERTDASALIVVDEFLGIDFARELTRSAPKLRCCRRLIRLPGPRVATTDEWRSFLSSGQDALEEADSRIAAGNSDDISDIIFTSGTTGKPKGVMLRHGTSLRCYESFNTAYGLKATDRHFITTPFSHCFGYKAGWMLSLLSGATSYPEAVFNADQALTLIEQQRITHMPGAPTIFSSLLQHPARSEFDLSSLRVAIVAAASISQHLIETMSAQLGFETIMAGYGLTENHALGTFTRPDDPLSVVANTVGRTAPGIEAKIIDDDGNSVAPGGPGELLLAGYAHMTGYYDDPDATAAAIQDGWLHTGDVATIDDTGLVRITDRKKDIFIVGGFNVAPAEVEAGLVAMDGIAQVAVVGIPDDHFGEVGVAFVVPQPGVTISMSDVISFARDSMANYKVPRRVEIVDSLPQNATGKVEKHVLRKSLDVQQTPSPDEASQ